MCYYIRKFIPFIRILPLLLLYISTGCKETNPEENEYIIGFSQCTAGDTWRKSMQEGMEREVSFYPNLTLIHRNAHENSKLQIQQIRELVNAGVNLLIISPNEAIPITPIVEELYNKGIPVVILDRQTTSKKYTAYVGSNNLEIGRAAGHYINTLLKGNGKVLEILGTSGASPTRDRHAGFVESIAQSPGIQLIDKFHGDWEQEYVLKQLPAMLAKHPDIDLIYAHNDRMALGAYKVCKQAGLEQKIKFIGVDGLAGPNGGIDLVEKGIINATMLYPTGGEEAIRTALRILRKQPFSKENILETMVINPANVHSLKVQSDKILSQQQDITRQQIRLQEQSNLYHNQRIVLYILVFLLIGAIILATIVFISLRENRAINAKLEAQNQEILSQRNQILDMAERLRESTEAKLRFFTNFSHELRTPLTLILGPIEDILTNKNVSPGNQRKDLELVRKNAQQLLHLVNLLMDFRKIEVGKMPLRVAQYDIVWFVQEIMNVFKNIARQRRITYRLTSSAPGIAVWFDANLLDKVFYNLLANAFKYTTDGGQILLHVSLDDSNESVLITVEDDGQGISQEEQQHIFEWFYQGNTSVGGTGIGLALSHELVQMHHGNLSVRSEVGNGCTFTVRLPLTQPDKTADSLPVEPSWTPSAFSPPTFDQAPLFEYTTSMPSLPPPNAEATVLVIEDNADLRAFLVSKLQPHFQVLEAADGNTGVTMAFENLPDIVVCDVVIPGQSGIQVVNQLKNDWRTSHIPAVMLTARNTPEQIIEGVQSGADLYIMKPFNPIYLIESMKTLLRSRERIRDHFRRELSLDTATLAPQRTDRKFVDDLTAVIEQNIANSELTVDGIAQAIGLSRMQLYRKSKALLGCGVMDYLQNIRLTKARQLLLRQNTTIAEVAYEVGFSSSTYFATAFKQKYNISPSEFKNLHTPSQN
ncbi:substrate-binding domain-containing protein [Arsenicibacter rosenii]|uniref:substrate-binding domain-containing protein n=1 Tax=Arsenicibacter rosenii TaxID=1750698 RepID=UPI0035B616C0